MPLVTNSTDTDKPYESRIQLITPWTEFVIFLSDYFYIFALLGVILCFPIGILAVVRAVQAKQLKHEQFRYSTNVEYLTDGINAPYELAKINRYEATTLGLFAILVGIAFWLVIYAVFKMHHIYYHYDFQHHCDLYHACHD
ncbi:unnamed protein product [Didymodactylos carnosus]|uniref:Uncharacterized protein n=1 Tax=Didymodactylos carnosus TaxID=1234261 RepID=A0A8S2KF88_9BILA|nr:unnamed protein product [Didymodactylos carnosus]CAF3839176.1 unnamed protein product [Didymodactylos carnosus]